MPIRGEQREYFDLSVVGVNRSDSPRHLQPGEAVIVQNFDFDREGAALIGRRGTLTLNDVNPLGGMGYDLHWTYDQINHRSYVVVVYDNGFNYKVAVWDLAVDVIFNDLNLHTAAPFNLTRGHRVSFVTAYNATLDRVVMYGTNGFDRPFYWDFTQYDGVWTGLGAPQAPVGNAGAEMRFGTGDFRLHHFCPVPFEGRTWAFLRDVEPVTVHWSDSDDGRCWIDEGLGNAGFLQAPQEDFKNPLRGLYPLGNRMMVFNIDSIGTISYTNNPDDPYQYRLLTRGQGAIHQQCIAPWRDSLLFIDKREPYLFMTNGAQIQPLDPERKIVSAIQQYVDWDSILCTRLRVWKNTALLSFDTRNNVDTGTDGNRWMAAISLTRKGPRGNPYFPWGFHKLQSNDILIADEGANVGYAWFTDVRPDPVSGNYYVRRLADFFDGAHDPFAVPPLSRDYRFGDYNRDNAPLETIPINYVLQTGYWNGGKPEIATAWKEFMTFTLDGDWEGTPAVGDVLTIYYRCEGWTVWNEIQVANVRKFGEVPFAPEAQGREIQFRFTFTSATAIPKIYGYGFTYKTKNVRI